MKFPHGTGFKLTGGISITIILAGGYSLVGTFLGVVDEERACDGSQKVFCPPIKVKVESDAVVCDESEFILLQLVCPFIVAGLPVIAAGTIIAVSVEQVLFITQGTSCDND